MATDPFTSQGPVPHGSASDMFNIYPMSDAWVSTTSDNHLYATGPDYQRFPFPCMDTSLESQPWSSNAMSGAVSNSIENAAYSSSSVFKTVSAPTHGRNVTAVAPQHTLYKLESASPKSYTTANFDMNHVQVSSNSSPSRDSQPSTLNQGSASSQTSLDPQSPPRKKRRSGRKPTAEGLELDSARATYLEKNRKAASKCRSKQKRQQDDLIEEARDIQRKNKCLKAEVAMLQGGMRELMDLVGQHNACSDTRLQQYVQRQADRLAAGTSRTPPFIEPSEETPTNYYY